MDKWEIYQKFVLTRNDWLEEKVPLERTLRRVHILLEHKHRLARDQYDTLKYIENKILEEWDDQ